MPTRKFGGKTFLEYDTYHYKSAAQQEARRLRKQGHRVRLAKSLSGWILYKRSKYVS
jgi:hypothetical protein